MKTYMAEADSCHLYDYYKVRNHSATLATYAGGTHLPAPTHFTEPMMPSLLCIAGNTSWRSSDNGTAFVRRRLV